ncbi:Thiamine monophosphate synthase [Sulfurimonas denitrificans DSM 1251]|jgi:thiamine-phosphate pyrophosphorylase|uniref:Thiamine monophosphate synthase n=1 Tax=Sulfurimonas denitrificans (strain ATCC 33889 / DSM 1251) TaxID=326298 RepID=Q30R65_SULDN|nr:thiamine phosphate synthase [Sulfurimonas denitrificans]ABB44516.1 Thiamine monophosphate synthase [Sulfurimonas denitrificans DSM 1251]MDD3441698.1 thiamine phosphate synthase [Sulfurimonas denitrificans]
MQKYLITSAQFYTQNSDIFYQTLYKQLKKQKPEYVLFRDKTATNYEELASVFTLTCKEIGGVKSFVHQDIYLAKALGADGVHLTSKQFCEIELAKSKNLEVIISTHSHEEVLQAQKLGADAVTYSPIFASPDKGEPKGVNDLEELLSKCKIKVFALGGIVTNEHVEMISKTKVYGFASIRYFI